MATISDAFAIAIQHHQAGQLQDAEQIYRQILAAEPHHADAIHLLGVIAHQLGKHALAVEYIERAIGLNGQVAAFHNNLGGAYHAMSRIPEALACYRRALELQPAYADAHNNLGNMSKDQGKLDEAVGSYRRALDLEPNFAAAHNNLGNALKDQGNLDEAANSYRRALKIQPDQAEARCGLGVLCAERNAPEEAENCFRQALVYHPRHAASWYQLSNLLRGKLPEQNLNAMRLLVADLNLPEDERADIHFGLAQVFDARKNFGQAAEHLRSANGYALARSRKIGHGYDPAVYRGIVDRLIATFTPAFFERLQGSGVESDRPVFIIGLPRSGTTLVEQILARHSQVFGAGELRLGGKDFEMLAPGGFRNANAYEALAKLSADSVQRVARHHLEELQEVNAAALRIVDKMPDNYLHLGLLATLFPRARFVHCRRDLRDVAVSCWMTRFTNVRWANDLEHIATRFRDYQRLMEHWRQVLPVPLLEIDYEETVADLDTVARRVVAWCGLEWEPACLAFHEGKSPVGTASATQVRKPLYTRSVGRWKNYEPFLGSLFAMLLNVGEPEMRN